MNIFIKLLFIVVFSSTLTSVALAQPHSHGARSHTHPLPTQGISHRHGNSVIGSSKRKLNRTKDSSFFGFSDKKSKIRKFKSNKYPLDQKGCMHSLLIYSVVWSGECKNGFATGYGVQKTITKTTSYFNAPQGRPVEIKQTYKGTLKRGKRTQGTLITHKDEGDYIYNGTYEPAFGDKKNGVEKVANGNYYKVTNGWTSLTKIVKRGKPSPRNVSIKYNTGTKSFPNGNIFKGTFKGSDPYKGTMIYPSGSVFKGEFTTSLGLPKNGVMTYKSGKRENFKKGVPVSILQPPKVVKKPAYSPPKTLDYSSIYNQKKSPDYSYSDRSSQNNSRTTNTAQKNVNNEESPAWAKTLALALEARKKRKNKNRMGEASAVRIDGVFIRPANTCATAYWGSTKIFQQMRVKNNCSNRVYMNIYYPSINKSSAVVCAPNKTCTYSYVHSHKDKYWTHNFKFCAIYDSSKISKHFPRCPL